MINEMSRVPRHDHHRWDWTPLTRVSRYRLLLMTTLRTLHTSCRVRGHTAAV